MTRTGAFEKIFYFFFFLFLLVVQGCRTHSLVDEMFPKGRDVGPSEEGVVFVGYYGFPSSHFDPHPPVVSYPGSPHPVPTVGVDKDVFTFNSVFSDGLSYWEVCFLRPCFPFYLRFLVSPVGSLTSSEWMFVSLWLLVISGRRLLSLFLRFRLIAGHDSE